MGLEYDDEALPEPTVIREPLVDLGIPSAPEGRPTGSKPRRRRLSDMEPEGSEASPAPAPPAGRPTLALSVPPAESLSACQSAPLGTKTTETPDLRPRASRPHVALTLSAEQTPGLRDILDVPQPGNERSATQGTEAPSSARERTPKQDFSFALLAGLAAAIVGAMVWALLTMATGLSLGCMAMGVGGLVGGTVRALGRGRGRSFGALGAGLALFGCLLGSLLSVCTIIAGQEGLSTVSVLVHVCSKPALIPAALVATFHALDPPFYSVALYAGYRLSFRRAAKEDAAK